ncbi:hypothetical protein MMC28_007093 [Mycoblastus sanguinarius]|nr:hypothetical protein [Mycoblastus sanguinarius]
MHSQSILTTSISLFSALASARIAGFAVPSTIASSSNFPITIITEDYSQSVQDIAMAFGLAPSASANNESLGTTLLSSRYLGPDDSNSLTNMTHFVTMPADLADGATVFTASLFSLYGVEYEPILTSFTASVTVGESTSSDLVDSTQSS